MWVEYYGRPLFLVQYCGSGLVLLANGILVCSDNDQLANGVSHVVDQNVSKLEIICAESYVKNGVENDVAQDSV